MPLSKIQQLVQSRKGKPTESRVEGADELDTFFQTMNRVTRVTGGGAFSLGGG